MNRWMFRCAAPGRKNALRQLKHLAYTENKAYRRLRLFITHYSKNADHHQNRAIIA
jgi:hypothetical protein